MELPAVFKSDISTKIISLFPIVVIDDSIFLSTKNHSSLGEYYKPILLNIPSIKESVDLETRNFKISNVNLKVSNYEIDGERFTDILKNKSYLGAKVKMYWQTSGAKSLSDALQIFEGTIRRITHDNKVANIQLEDLTQILFHREIPSRRTSTSISLPSAHRNKPIPVVYGHLPKAPTVFDVGNTIKADAEDLHIVGRRGSGESWDMDDAVSEYYQPHPMWDDFLQQQGTTNNQGVPALTMVIDGYEVYVPEETTKGQGYSNSGIYTKDGTDQWVDSGGVAGQISLQVQKYNISGEENTRPLIQVINAMKSPSIKCHYRYQWNDNSQDEIHVMNDAGNGWQTQNRFNDRITEVFSDGEYSPLHELDSSVLNGWHPYSDFPISGGYTYWWITEFYEPDGTSTWNYRDGTDTNEAEANQTLMRVSIETEPPFEYFKIYKMVQLSINGFDFPRMSSWGDDGSHSMYLTARTLEGDWDGNGNSDEGILRLARYNNARRCSLSTRIDGTSDHAPFGSLYHGDGRPDWKFKYLFGFDGIEGTNNYSGLQPGDTGYDDLIRVYDLSCEGYGYNSSTGADHPDPTVESWYIQITQSTAALGEINLSWGAYISDLNCIDETNKQHDVKWHMALGGKWSEVDILQLLDIENPMQRDYYLNVLGRHDEDGLITNPIAILRDIAINELGLDEDMIDEETYTHAAYHHNYLSFAFSINKAKNSKKIIEEIAKGTKCYPYFKNNGKLAFPSLQTRYGYESGDISHGYVDALTINEKDIINFSFNKTKPEKVYTHMDFYYDYSYVTEEYRKNKTWLSLTDSELEYNGYESQDENVLKVEFPYITDSSVANDVYAEIFRYHKNSHLEVKIKLPLNYIELEVGSLIKFENLINGVLAYGIDYTKVTRPPIQDGGQWIYPIFFVSSVNKNMNSVEIVAQQVHQTWKDWDGELYEFDDWLAAGLVQGFTLSEDVVIPNEEVFPPEGEEGEDTPAEEEAINTILMDVYDFSFRYYFYFPEDVLGSYLLHWFNFQAWNLSSFDDVIPNNFDDLNNNTKREYSALEFNLKTRDDGVVRKYQYKSIEDLGWEFKWVEIAQPGEQFDYIVVDDNYLVDIDGALTPFSEVIFQGTGPNWLAYTQGFMQSFSSGQFDNYNQDAGGLEFTSEMEFSGVGSDPDAAGTGDVNQDFRVDILDIVALVNFILGTGSLTEQGQDAADFNNDTTVNILDVIAIVIFLMGDID